MKYFCLVLCTLWSLCSFADDQVSAKLFGPNLKVGLENTTSYCAFQMDITLPEGVTVSDVKPVETRLSQSGSSDEIGSSKFIVAHNMIENNTLRVLGYNLANSPIAAQDGELLNITLDELGVDASQVSVSNILFVKSEDLSEVQLADATGEEEVITSSYTLDMRNKTYSTVCVPFTFTVPSGLKLYSLDSYDPETKQKVVTRVTKPEANKPYLAICSTDKVFTLSGTVVYADPEAEDYLRLGALTGLYEKTKLKPYDIVLVKDKFKSLTESTATTVSANKAYIKFEGEFVDYSFTLNSSNYTTICVPFVFTPPTGVYAYVVTDYNPATKKATTKRVPKTMSNKPYLVKAAPYTTYTVSGPVYRPDEIASLPLKYGVLRGTYEDIYAPVASYVIPNPETEKPSWYYVSSDNSVLVEANHAYIDPILLSGAKLVIEFDETDVVDEIIDFYDDADAVESVYSIDGIKLQNTRRGLNIIKMSDGSTKVINQK